jgi:hypothetical protein
MGTLDDAIREHLELKRRLGASDEELKEKENEAFGGAGSRMPAPPPDPTATDEVLRQVADQPGDATGVDAAADVGGDPWAPSDEDLLEDEVLPDDSLERNGSVTPPPPIERGSEDDEAAEEPHEDPFDEWDEEPAPTEDVLRETPEFLEETPEHDRLWFEQKPPKDFDFD